jgi:MFS family permease
VPHTSSRPSSSSSPWRSLHRPSFVAWSFANLLSNLGTWLQLIAQNVLVLKLTGSPALAGVCATASATPALVLAPVGGALVDRYSRRLVATLTQTALALIAAGTAVLAWRGGLTPTVLILVSLAAGAIGALNAPATALLGIELVEPEDVPSAISVGSVITTIGWVGGAALAGVVLATGGVAVAYVLNALSFLCVVAVIAALPRTRPGVGRAPGAPARPHGGPARPPGAALAGVVLATGGVAVAYVLNALSFLCVVAVIAALPRTRPGVAERRAHPRDRTADLLGGVRWLAGRPRLLLLATVSGLAAVLGRNYGLMLAPITLTALHAGGSGYGAVNVALGVGATLGAIAAGRLRSPSVRLGVLLAVAGAGLQIAVSGAPALGALLAGAVLMSGVESVAATVSSTLLMTTPPAEVRGRVMGAWGTVSTLCGMVGPLAVGGLLSLAGPRLGLAAGGVAFLGAVAVVSHVYLRHVHGRTHTARAWRATLRPAVAVG